MIDEKIKEAEKSYYFVIRICRIEREESNIEKLETQDLFYSKVSTLDEIPKMIEERIEKSKAK